MRFAILFLAFCTLAYSQLPDFLLEEKEQFYPNTYKFLDSKTHHSNEIRFLSDSKIIERNYDVISYDLTIDLYDIFTKEFSEENRRYDAINVITLVLTDDDFQFIEFDANSMTINAIKIGTLDLQPVPEIQDGKLTIPFLYEYYEKGDTARITIDYTYNGSDNVGFHFYDEGTLGFKLQDDAEFFIPEKIAYTLGEPIFARHWMPCNDNPHDKAIFNVTGIVPEDYTFVANGLQKSKTIEDGKATFQWESEIVTSTYLMHFATSVYETFTDYYKPITMDGDSIEVRNWVWKDDLLSEEEGGIFKPKATLAVTKHAIEYFASVFNEYPYEKYGTVAVSPFYFGGMEHQSITTINWSWLRGYTEAGIIHEAAHHWIGNMVTCGTWNDLWINEGGATWFEALWMLSDYKGGHIDNYNQVMYWKAHYYLREDSQHSHDVPIYGIPINDLFGDLYMLSYDKASWLNAMLAEAIGLENFTNALKSIFEKYKFQSLESHEYIAALKDAIGDEAPFDLDAFFEQWLYKSGHPILDIRIESKLDEATGKHDLNITAEQIQTFSNGPEFFFGEMDIKIFDETMEKSVIATLKFDSRTATTNTTTDFLPNETFMTGTKMLGTIENVDYVIDTSVEDSEKDVTVYPNPLVRSDVLHINGENIQNVTVNNLFGEQQQVGINNYGNSFSLNTRNLTAGTYIIQLQKFGGEIVFEKLSIIK